jgi:hypothetical protein
MPSLALAMPSLARSASGPTVAQTDGIVAQRDRRVRQTDDEVALRSAAGDSIGARVGGVGSAGPQLDARGDAIASVVRLRERSVGGIDWRRSADRRASRCHR